MFCFVTLCYTENCTFSRSNTLETPGAPRLPASQNKDLEVPQSLQCFGQFARSTSCHRLQPHQPAVLAPDFHSGFQNARASSTHPNCVYTLKSRKKLLAKEKHHSVQPQCMQFGSVPTKVIGVGELQIVQTRQFFWLSLTFSKSNGWTSIHPESAALAPTAKFTHAGRNAALELVSLDIGYHL